MSNLNEKIQNIRTEFETILKKTTTIKDLDAVKVRFLGKKGQVSFLMGELKSLTVEEKREFGPLLIQLKKENLMIVNILK